MKTSMTSKLIVGLIVLTLVASQAQAWWGDIINNLLYNNGGW